MNLNEKALLTEIKHKVLETVVMVSDGFSEAEVINNLLEVIDVIESNEPRRIARCNVKP